MNEKRRRNGWALYLPVILLFLAMLIYLSAVLYADIKYPHVISGTSEERYFTSTKRIDIENGGYRASKALFSISYIVCIVALCKLPYETALKNFFRGCARLIILFAATLPVGFLYSRIREGYDKVFFMVFVDIIASFVFYFIAFGVKCLLAKTRTAKKEKQC